MIRTITKSDLPVIMELMKSVEGFWHGEWTDKTLINKVENKLKEVGCELIIVDVLPSAILFYEKIGRVPPYVKLYKKKL